MVRRIILLVLVMLFALNGLVLGETSTKSEFSIRNGIKFGMTAEEIEERETARLYAKEKGGLFYDDIVAGLETFIVYKLGDNGNLIGIVYFFLEEHSAENLYINDYNNVNKDLFKKYGEVEVQESWMDDLYKDDQYKYGFAVSIGDLAYNTEWETDDVWIQHVLKGDNYEIEHLMVYTDASLLREYLSSESVNDDL